jgi:hypothetical protein
MKKKRSEAIKVVEAHIKSYQVFLQNRDFLYQMKLKRNYLFFTSLRQSLLIKSQRIIKKHWFAIRGLIRAKRDEERDFMKRALRKFTVQIYQKAKRNLEIIIHFRKYRRTPCHRSWSARSLK